MTWEPGSGARKSSFEVSFVLIGSPARQWNGPAAPQLVVPADGTCFSGPVFHTDLPPPPSSHPGSGAARAEYASRSPHRPIQLFTARSPGNQLGRQQVRYFRLENCPFVRALLRPWKIWVRLRHEGAWDTNRSSSTLLMLPMWFSGKFNSYKKAFCKINFWSKWFWLGKSSSNTFFRHKYHMIKFGYCKN